MIYEEPNKNNVKKGDFFATIICNTVFIRPINQIKEDYALYVDRNSFVKAFYRKSVIRQNGKLLIGKDADKSLVKKLENFQDENRNHWRFRTR